VKLAAWREVDAKLEALRTSAAQVWGLVLSNADGSSSLTASLSAAAELLEDRIDATTANGVHWWSCSTLAIVVSHLLELKTEQEVLGSGCSADLIEDEADALWIQVCAASDLLASG
jgi:hypothetical protein